MTDGSVNYRFGNLQIAWLEAFVMTVDFGKGTAAAKHLGVSSGTLSKRITKLECWLGEGTYRPLMAHNMFPPTLTADGTAFLPVARKVLEQLQTAQMPKVKLERST